MPDATYVGAGMPCGNCGNPLTLGQPHKCGRTPDQPRDDGTHGTRWLAGKLPPDKEVVLAHHYDDLLAAALPDERLREALREIVRQVEEYPALSPTGIMVRDDIAGMVEGTATAALAAADRVAPDEPRCTCRCGPQVHRADCPIRSAPPAPPVSDEQENGR